MVQVEDGVLIEEHVVLVPKEQIIVAWRLGREADDAAVDGRLAGQLQVGEAELALGVARGGGVKEIAAHDVVAVQRRSDHGGLAGVICACMHGWVGLLHRYQGERVRMGANRCFHSCKCMQDQCMNSN